MPALPHLPLKRVIIEQDRRRKRGFPRSPQRDPSAHGTALSGEVESTLQNFQKRTLPKGIRAELILRIKLDGSVDQATWERLGLTIIGQNDDKTLVLFASDIELRKFREQLNEYQGGPPSGQKGAPHGGLFNTIAEVGQIEPPDRIGRLLRQEGTNQPNQFTNTTTYTVDLELWHTGDPRECKTRLEEIRKYITDNGGSVTDDYLGPALVLARIKAKGSIIRQLLTLDAVATIDLPPKVSLRVSQQLELNLQDLPPVNPPPDNAPGVCVIDSGITPGHPLLGPAVGEATVTAPSLPSATDEHGHGTRVAGLTLYGDVQDCIEAKNFQPTLKLFSARVLNKDNEFDDEKLIPTLMRNAIDYFRRTYNCRVFNVSIADPRTPYLGGKVSAWAEVLDHLAREHNIVIVVSAGNYFHEPANDDDNTHHLKGYPKYLLEDPAHIIEPATGAIVLTVGSLAHSATVPPSATKTVTTQPIAQVDQPSPFTRSGPGIGRSIKPEVCEYGGNAACDLLTKTTRSFQEMSVVSLHTNYVERLFNADFGTSFAAPKIAHIAGKLFAQFPTASANLIRALIANSARVPVAAQEQLDPLKGTLRLCGYGVPSQERAAGSASNRVVLYAEGEMPLDAFHLYEVPIPNEFYEGSGQRTIRVSLAFDPQVRHSRLDYLGSTMYVRLLRGKTQQEVIEAFRKRGQDEDAVDRITGSADCKLGPGPRAREGGTLQQGEFIIKKVLQRYGETYHLVVGSQRKWIPEDDARQRYAIAVSIEHQAEVDLYSRIQARVRQPVRVQTRGA